MKTITTLTTLFIMFAIIAINTNAYAQPFVAKSLTIEKHKKHSKKSAE